MRGAVRAAGVGGKKDDSSNPTSPDRQEAIERACEVNQKCDPDEFATDYGDLDGCLEYGDESLSDYEDQGPECGEPALDFLVCYTDAYSATCDDSTVLEECFEEATSFLSSCDVEHEY